MAKYVSFFTYTSDAWARMIQRPGDRTTTIRQVADSLGGSVDWGELPPGALRRDWPFTRSSCPTCPACPHR